jgi:ankyrin repeat protein
LKFLYSQHPIPVDYPLVLAAANNYIHVLKFLLSKPREKSLHDALTAGIRFGYPDIVRLLLEHRALDQITNIRDFQNDVDRAVVAGHLNTIKLLLDWEAPIRQHSALYLAQNPKPRTTGIWEEKRRDIVKLFRDRFSN